MTISTLENLSLQANQALNEKDLKVVTAESCTGGGIGYWLSAIPGSSKVFERGFITYSNEAKIEQLGVSPMTIETHGAVSEQTAIAMAEGALRHSNSDISIAVTGIAGPDGGTPSKPVGTVWFAIASCHTSTVATLHVFSGNRQQIRDQTIEMAMQIILKHTAGK